MIIKDLYNAPSFVDVWDDSDDFKAEYQASVFYDYEEETVTENGVTKTITHLNNSISEPRIELLFGLLYAKYGNNPISGNNLFQFKTKLFSIIYKYGPEWETKLNLQQKIRDLKDEDIVLGSKTIYNHAFNDAGSPSTAKLDELTYINDQNTTNYKRSPLEGLILQWDALANNTTEEFINKFQVCFQRCVYPQWGGRVTTEIEED